ncbi:MAG TPA: F0F1 ATP synthase subunit B [Spirochaetota bacterium]|nr:F0F1 ATP synthase subunit B [Spirochaetota bacterium]HOD15790.1 F0F1 ATP synthase subunit B [Spirochaetota bacterium]HQL83194.1 F0F1 ATP synthase subunit B [Spirochaetota bacterium]
MDFLKEGLLRVDPGLLLWTVITFLVMMGILWKVAWRPIVDAMDARAEKVRFEIDNAERTRQEAEKLLAQHKAMMDNSRNEAAQIIAKGREEAERMKNEIVEKASAESRTIADRAKKEIELAKDKAIIDIKTEVVVLSTEIASKIINKNIKAEDQKALVEEALNKMGTVQ